MSEQLSSRIQGGLQTVQKWESEDLLAACREEIPFHELCPEQFFLPNSNGSNGSNEDRAKVAQPSPYARPDDDQYHGDDLLLKRLTLYFQGIMTWVNNPPCELCGSKETKNKSTRGPVSKEEIDGQATRVEVYFCPTCFAETTTFPRYNNPKKLLETKKGRCGEYANLFGAFCRSAGFETRYILDFTDHVWVEVWSNETSRWIMADGCEGKIDEPSMYEKGWGKKLCYNIAITVDSVADVTRRYTRKFNSFDFQARRRQFTPGGDSQSDMIVAHFNSTTRASQRLSKTKIDELDRRERSERRFLDDTLKQETWGSGAYTEGRLSGSLGWRISRGEAGDIQSNDESNETINETPSEMYHVDCFHPAPYRSLECPIVISAPPSEAPSTFPGCITVMGTPCGTGIPQTISIVVVDEKYSCILQSRVFGNWDDASSFLSKLPDGRIVAVYTDLSLDIDPNIVGEKLVRLGSFNISALSSEGKEDGKYFFYVGQVNYNPEWAVSQNGIEGSSLRVKVGMQTDEKLSGLKLQRKAESVPQIIRTRLPDEFMSLQSQLIATDEDKKRAFLRFMGKEIENPQNDHRYIGYTTKEGLPIYLMSKEAFPFKKSNKGAGKGESSWTTYHYVPEPMWYEEVKQSEPEINIDLPIDEGYFNSLFGNKLLKNVNNSQSEISTVAALSNSRLVALYFSAHWCPPCRKFTPLLCEMYEHLKSEYPTHGLEIVFVSSDRDESSFQNYSRSMPWLSVPWGGEGVAIRQRISQRFPVRGIPSLIVLDTISGSIVVPAEHSREDVMKACRGGEESIEQLLENNWFQCIPVESKNMMDILKLSCAEDMDCDETEDDKSNPYLVRSHDEVVEKEPVKEMTKEEQDAKQKAKIQKYFHQFFSEGMTPNEAAVKAINKVASESAASQKGNNTLLPGTLKGTKSVEVEEPNQNVIAPADLKLVLSTAKKYVDNVAKKPSTAKFRNFKLSNKVFDNITSLEGGLDYLVNQLGFRAYNNDMDFIASIPLSIDIMALRERIDNLLSS